MKIINIINFKKFKSKEIKEIQKYIIENSPLYIKKIVISFDHIKLFLVDRSFEFEKDDMYLYKYYYSYINEEKRLIKYKKYIKRYKFMLNKLDFIYKKNLKFMYEILNYNWNKYLLYNNKYNLFITNNNYIKYLYKYNLKSNLYLNKNLYFINNNLINNYIIYKNNYNIYNNQVTLYKNNLFLIPFNNNFYNKIYYNYSYKHVSNIHLNDITTGLQYLNIIFENKSMKNPIALISDDVYVIFYVKCYNYIDNMIYLYNICNKYDINFITYELNNNYSYIYEDISSILYSGYSLNSDFYSIDINLKNYFNYLSKNTNIYQATRSSYIYVYNIILESLLKQYNYQNIYLPSIYFELIIRKMLSCVKIISDIKESNLFKFSDKVPLYLINMVNYSLTICEQQSYKYEPIILSVTKAILATSGFLTNMTFQNILKNLSSYMVHNKIDWLVDIKSKIMMSDLLPIGSGWYRYLANNN